MLSTTSVNGITYKVLGQENPTANTPTDVYITPSNFKTVVSALSFCNQSNTATQFNLAVKPTGSNLQQQHFINYNVSLPAFETVKFTGITLSNAIIVANIQSSNVSVSVFGHEQYVRNFYYLELNTSFVVSEIFLNNILSGNIWSTATTIVGADPITSPPSILWEGTKYIVVGGNGALSKNYIYKSNVNANVTLPESNRWTLTYSALIGVFGPLSDIIDTGTKLITYGGGGGAINGTYLESLDRGNTWVTNSNMVSTGISLIQKMIWTGNLLVAGATDGEIAYSNNLGNTWTLSNNLNSTPFGPQTISYLIYGNNKIIAISDTGSVGISTDANIWTYDGGLYNSNYDLVYQTGGVASNRGTFVRGNFVLTDGFGKLVYSSDGNVWNYSRSLEAFDMFAVPKIFDTSFYAIAVGNAGKIAYSKDLLTWYYTNSLRDKGWVTSRSITGITKTDKNLLIIGTDLAYASSQGSSVSNVSITVNWTNPTIGSSIILGNGISMTNIVLSANVSGTGIANSIVRYYANALPSNVKLVGNVISGTPNVISNVSTRLTATFGINGNIVSTTSFSDIIFIINKITNGLFAWGTNTVGQLGDGTTTQRLSPVKIASNNWLQVSAGPRFSAGIDETGNLYTWGTNITGQLGDGTTTQRNNPTKVGSNVWSYVTTGGSAGSSGYTLAIRNDGLLFAWGDNSDGQLGDGTTTQRNSPVQIGGSNTWVQVEVASSHTLAIRSDGNLFAWGANPFGQLGDGTTTSSLIPKQIGSNVWVKIAAGRDHSMGVQQDGNLYTWGLNLFGRLGDGTGSSAISQKNSPTKIGSNVWVKIAAGAAHSMGVQQDGNLYTWGLNGTAQLGDGTATNRNTPTKIGSNVWIDISGGEGHSAGIQQDNKLYTWGLNASGQLGDGTTTGKSSPKLIDSNVWAQISAGYDHTLGLKRN